jgi:hypothetical protein
MLCSSAWVVRQAAKETIIEVRHLLIASEYDYALISDFVSTCIRDIRLSGFRPSLDCPDHMVKI